VECQGKDSCPVKSGVRIPLREDRRVFTPVARSSAKWEKLHNKRTSVERVNSRIDQVFGFEDHCIRGLKKMELECLLALLIMLAMALGRIKTKQKDKPRNLVQAA
jgi:virulence-associated protein VagC